VAFANERPEPLGGRVDSSREAGGPATNDHDVVDLELRLRRQTRPGRQLAAPTRRGAISVRLLTVNPAGDRFQVPLDALEFGTVADEEEWQTAATQMLGIQQSSERIMVKVDPAMSNPAAPEEIPPLIHPRGATAPNDRDPFIDDMLPWTLGDTTNRRPRATDATDNARPPSYRQFAAHITR
jgi:hypothetical protein